MRKSSLYLFAAFVCGLISCQRSMEEAGAPQSPLTQITATTEGEAPTRTYLEEGNSGTSAVLWSENDAISVFIDSDTKARVFSLKEGAGTKTGVFQGEGSGSNYLAFYPAAMEPVLTNGNLVRFTLPAQQQYVPDSFQNGVYPMLAQAASGALPFHNLASVLRLSISGTLEVTRIVFRSANPAIKVSGPAMADMDDGLVMDQSALDSLVLNASVQLQESEPTHFYLVLPPQTYTGGFTVRVYDHDYYMEKTYTQDFTMQRSKLHKAEAFVFQYEKEEEDPDEQDEEDWKTYPFHHQSLIMRFTGTWCGWCPYMNKAVSIAQEQYPGKLQHVALHYDGDLHCADAVPLVQQYGINAFPTGIVDGRALVGNTADPAVTAQNLIAAFLETEQNYPVVTGTAISSTVNGREVSIDVKAYLKKGDNYKITVLLLEDAIVNPQSGASDDYVHDCVARMAVTQARGEAFSVSNDQSEKTFHYNVTVPTAYVLDNMRVLVYIQRSYGEQPVIRSSSSYGDFYVDNCATAALGVSQSVELEYTGEGGNEGIQPGGDIDVE